MYLDKVYSVKITIREIQQNNQIHVLKTYANPLSEKYRTADFSSPDIKGFSLLHTNNEANR
jgi:hypothetical protein